MAETTFSAVAHSVEGLATTCTARGKSITLDEPPSLGGTDQGMNPVEALLSALGACKCIVANVYAAKQGIRLRDVRIELDGTIDPDGFLGVNPDAKVGFSEIVTRYHLDTDNTPQEVAAFVDFVEAHCPVHDTLANPARLRHEIA